ncbi:hypothetical protein FJW08_03195 [Mesorhizobium sp. B3-2-1]|uniref:hypothetical protein n=1 Tax=Mesorhizobium sp. B3-2-1 TaxID=2589891 RepID=UPI0011282C48|nr:hypothetical protein [Mesorhizobium sp. B3-2-1]TPI34604.1 hypothetical protein FJW08_03195 [Mesorhizobium sp. B3-2-1]
MKIRVGPAKREGDSRTIFHRPLGSGDFRSGTNGGVTHLIDGNRVTVNLGIPVTLDADTVKLMTPYKPPTRRIPLVDKAT